WLRPEQAAVSAWRWSCSEVLILVPLARDPLSGHRARVQRVDGEGKHGRSRAPEGWIRNPPRKGNPSYAFSLSIGGYGTPRCKERPEIQGNSRSPAATRTDGKPTDCRIGGGPDVPAGAQALASLVRSARSA